MVARMSTGGRLQQAPKAIVPRVLSKEDLKKKQKEAIEEKFHRLRSEGRQIQERFNRINGDYIPVKWSRIFARRDLVKAQKNLSEFEQRKRKTGTRAEREAQLSELRLSLRLANEEFERASQEYEVAKVLREQARKDLTNSSARYRRFDKTKNKWARREAAIVKRKETLKRKSKARAAKKSQK